MTIFDVLKQRKDVVVRKRTENDILAKQMQDNEKQMNANLHSLTIGQEALQFLEDVAQSRRNTMKSKIEGIISDALRVIYGPDYRIELVYSTKNNRSSLEIELVKKTPKGEVRRTMEGFGGGVSDSISVPLRLLILLGSRQTDKVCVLDESYKHVDPERIELVAKFIKEISHKLNMQIVLLSHHEAMQETADVIFQIQDVGGKATLKKM
jgi:DNA repair exonuclease SbcCD ATPase subunit